MWRIVVLTNVIEDMLTNANLYFFSIIRKQITIDRSIRKEKKCVEFENNLSILLIY